MILMQLQGGLGNQMFQYALGLVLAHLNQTGLQLDTSYYPDVKGRTYDLSCFVMGEPLMQIRQRTRPNVMEKGFTFDPTILALRGNLYLEGYWQSEKYFQSHAGLVRWKLGFTSLPRNGDMYRRILDSHSVAIHVRRGDYATDPHTRDFHGLLPREYYASAWAAVKHADPLAEAFIFTDDPYWDGLADLPGFGHIVPGDTHEHLKLMSQCQHHIIANSTFSWWGAWLATRGGTVITPKKWFNNADLDAKDLVPSGWMRLEF